MRRNLIVSWLVMISIFFSSGKVVADETSELRAQIQKMQEENARMREQLDRQNKAIEGLTKKMEALEGMETKNGEEAEDREDGLDIPKLKLKGFADLGLNAKLTDNGNNSTFSRGELDFFITSELADNVSFLAESVFEANTDTNAQDLDLERAELKYSISDLFNIKAGRMHTPLGYWNQEFHHGTWLQTSIFRPEAYLFEHDGGMLPVHSVGIELFGTKPFSLFDLEYNFDIINGRGRTRTTIQNAKDNNDSKAINALISIKPHFIEGLKLGADIYYDKIPSNPSDANRTKQINELILGGYFAYLHNRLELLGELFNIQHEDKTSEKDFDTLGFYLQGSYKINKFRPYYRFDFIDFGDGDPFFTAIDKDIKKHTLGLRWDILTWNALKFEYSHSDKKDSDNEDLFSINSSLTF